MARLHPTADLTPSKPELIAQWLPTRDWYDGTPREVVAAFRLDDPEGAVGMEGFLLGADGASTLVVAFTYRDAPLEGAEEHLVATMEHSVLGKRWVHDACGDPVFAQALATTILTGGRGGEREFTDADGQEQVEPTSAQVRGSGSADTEPPVVTRAHPYDEGPLTVVDAGDLELVLARELGTEVVAAQTLTVEWDGQSAVLAGVRVG